jgi:hypothetical protein
MRKVTEKVELGGHEIILPSWADGVQLEVDLTCRKTSLLPQAWRRV